MTAQPEFGSLHVTSGGHLRHALWRERGPMRGTVLLLPGRAECAEKYQETAGELTELGWRVRLIEWRGQGLSSRFLPDGRPGHVPDFGTYLDDLDAAVEALLPLDPAGPVVAIAHSLGGHVVLRFAAERRNPFTALALSNPMTGLRPRGRSPRTLRLVARIGVLMGRAARYAPGQGHFLPASPPPFDGNTVTSCAERFHRNQALWRANPELALGGVTYGWLDAAFRSLDRLWRAPLERIEVPVLILASPGDRVIDPASLPRLASRLPQARMVEFPEGRHELFMERDPIRQDVVAQLQVLLQQVAGATTSLQFEVF